MARPKKTLENVDIKEIPESLHRINTKRELDIYRDTHGNLEGISLFDLNIDIYTFKNLSIKGSVFKNVKFIDAKFQGLDFTGAQVDNCVFHTCDLRWSTFTKEQRDTNDFINCNEREINVVG